jgi:tetratricopeptide (TPR) repeat protein
MDSAQLRGLAIAVFRLVRDLTQGSIEQLLGVRSKTISAWEKGHGATVERLETLARSLGFRPVQVARTLHSLEQLLQEDSPPSADPFGPTPAEELAIYERSLAVARIAESWLREDLRRAKIEQDRAAARELWDRMKAFGLPKHWAAVIRTLPECQTWAMVELLCEESVEAAAKDAGVAGEIAELALMTAELVDVPWRNVLLGYAWAHVGNALRVAGELTAADLVFAWVHELWSPAAAAAVGELDPGRVPSLEASLRRDQRRFPEALKRLDDAFLVSWTPGRILLKRAATSEQMGDYAAAVEELRRADELLVKRTEREDVVLRFNLGAVLCHLGRFNEAAELVPRVLDQAEALGNELDSIRGMWLQGRVTAGLGEPLVAVGAFKLAAREFGQRRMDYDAALVGLELGTVLLELGRYAEVKSLSRGLAPIFKRKGVHREAEEALRLFQNAVERETATAELARRIVAFLYLARGNEGLRFDAAL